VAAPTGISATNSGGVCFLYNNLQAQEFGTNSSNTNSVGLLPIIMGLDPQSALQMSARHPGGVSFRAPNNSAFVSPTNTNATASLIGGDFGVAIARLGYTKGGALLIASNSNGTSAVTFDTTNTQANTNSYWGDTTFTTVNVMVFQNLSGLDGISSGNGSWYVNGSATNGAVLNLNTNGTYVVKPNGGTVVIADVNGFNSAAATCKVLCTPVNGGVLAVSIYGS